MDLLRPHRTDTRSPEYREKVEELVQLTGHEFPARDHGLGLDLVLHHTGVALGIEERDALALALTFLSQHPRFAGNQHLAPEAGEDPATHSLQTALLCEEIISKSGITGLERLEMVDTAVRASLIHDMGEILGEHSTLHGRLQQGSAHDTYAFERKLTESSLQLALMLNDLKQPDIFKDYLNEFARTLRATGDFAAVTTTFQELLETLPAHHSHLSTVARWMRLYDATEVTQEAPEEDRFVGYLVKTVEHLQGSQHFLRFSRKDDSVQHFTLQGEAVIPWAASQAHASLSTEQARSHIIIGVIRYIEGTLGDLTSSARTPGEQRVAETTCRAVYQYIREFLDVAPAVLERSATDRDQELGATLRKLSSEGRHQEIPPLLRGEQVELLREHRAARQWAGDPNLEIFPVETRVRLQALYQNAAESGFTPAPGEVLIEAPHLPPLLTPLNATTAGLSRRRPVERS